MRVAWAIMLVLLAGSRCAQAAEWRAIPQQSRLGFEASYEGQAAPGIFRQFTVELTAEGGSPQGGRLRVTVDLSSVDMDSADVNETVVQSEWLNVARHPRAVFESTAVSRTGPGHYRARGSLALKGIARRLDVPFQWSVEGGQARMTGRLVVRRTDFHIGTGEWASGDPIGLDVMVHFEVALRRRR